jgi:predicted GTPase
MKFLIGPVRRLDDQTDEVKKLMNGYLNDPDVYCPGRDTNQTDKTGLNICKQNMQAIKDSDEVLFIWDGKSEGCLFDLGIAFCMHKKITVISAPELTEGKSFQNMVIEYSKEYNT